MLIKCLWDNGPEQAETGALSPSFIVLKILVDNYYYYLINYYKAAPFGLRKGQITLCPIYICSIYMQFCQMLILGLGPI
jgi:hypothetical protein